MSLSTSVHKIDVTLAMYYARDDEDQAKTIFQSAELEELPRLLSTACTCWRKNPPLLVKAFMLALGRGMDPNTQGCFSNALKIGNPRVVRAFLERGAVHDKEKNMNSGLLHAIYNFIHESDAEIRGKKREICILLIQYNFELPEFTNDDIKQVWKELYAEVKNSDIMRLVKSVHSGTLATSSSAVPLLEEMKPIEGNPIVESLAEQLTQPPKEPNTPNEWFERERAKLRARGF